jgi:hypothetical protein
MKMSKDNVSVVQARFNLDLFCDLHMLGLFCLLPLLEAICCNPSLGLATKARGLQGCGLRGSPRVTPHVPKSVRRCEGVNPHTPKATPTCEMES